MTINKSAPISVRVIHRYLGFFLAGVMAMYSLSGIVLIFRNTDFLKKEIKVEANIGAGITKEELGSKLKLKGLKVIKMDGDVMTFKNGTYNQVTGESQYTKKDLPYVLSRMTHLHKATTDDPLYFVNIFFGLSLLFFVISSFWMFMPSSNIFKKGMYFTLGGIVLMLIMLFI